MRVCRHGRSVDAVDLKRDASGVDVPVRALRTADRHLVAIMQRAGRRIGSDDTGQPEFARDDGRVCRASAFVGHNRGHASHHGFPVRVGHLRHQHVAGLHRLERFDIPHHPDAAAPDALTHRLPSDQWDTGCARQPVHFRHRRARLRRMDGLGSRLHDEQLATDPVLGPLDVHGLGVPRQVRIVRLDEAGPPRQRQHVVVSQAEQRPFGDRGRLAACGFAPPGVHESDFFRAKLPADDRAVIGRERGLEHGPDRHVSHTTSLIPLNSFAPWCTSSRAVCARVRLSV